ncbi:stressosome-associated protein Prli42 [Abyssicoccus albus]|nr:stressosome-associated protein Prli42 [Abyssicoccus albus]
MGNKKVQRIFIWFMLILMLLSTVVYGFSFLL